MSNYRFEADAFQRTHFIVPLKLNVTSGFERKPEGTQTDRKRQLWPKICLVAKSAITDCARLTYSVRYKRLLF